MYIVAVASALILISVQFLLHSKKGIFSTKKQYRLNISFKEENNESALVKELFNVEHFYKFNTTRNQDKVICDITLFTEKIYSSEQLNLFMKENPFIISIQRVDENKDVDS